MSDNFIPIHYMRTLTISLKNKYFERIKERDGAFACYYCNDNLSLGKFVYEHLNDDRSDNRIENIVFACQSCNNKKPYDNSIQEMAREKLVENESNVLYERNFEKREVSPEIEANEMGLQMTREYLEEKLKEDEYIDYKDTLHSITSRLYDEQGHASSVTVGRHIELFCCSEGKYEIVKHNRKRMITKKKGVLGGRGEVKRVAKRKENLVPVNVLHYMLINNDQSTEYHRLISKVCNDNQIHSNLLFRQIPRLIIQVQNSGREKTL